MWPFRRTATAGQSNDRRADIDPSKCQRCGRVIEVDPDLSVGAFEGMHWLCFHLEFEHNTDPDVACSDILSCPWWTIRNYEQKLRDLGYEPADICLEALERTSDTTEDAATAPRDERPDSSAQRKRQVVYVDVDDTLIRSVGSKRVPMPNVVGHIRSMFEAGAELYCWSTGGAAYAAESARELGLHQCFAAFLPKPQVVVDDEALSEWRLEHRHPLNCYGADSAAEPQKGE